MKRAPGRPPKPVPKHALQEGVAPIIWKRILAPLIRYKPVDQDLKQFLEMLFHTNERPINRYVARKQFSMPGLYYVSSAIKVQGIGPRHVNENDVLWVRTDSRNPNEIQVEIERKTRGHLFSLDSSQWGWIELHIEREEAKGWSR